MENSCTIVTHARRLFRFLAALFNFLVAAALLFFFPLTARVLQFGPTLEQSLFTQISAAAVMLFSWMYWQAARDPIHNRNYIVVGIIGKLAVVAIAYGNVLTGKTAFWPIAALTTCDLFFFGVVLAFFGGGICKAEAGRTADATAQDQHLPRPPILTRLQFRSFDHMQLFVHAKTTAFIASPI